ncbi:hypothetical protein BDZ45DRAFT_679425 [Acephala macrosclerotiorum]|nr:hypothetical protein BDZ45DRAFT_679425 [Acephala macrosclerotiorum]
MSIVCGPNTYTLEELRAIWRESLVCSPAFPKKDDFRWSSETLFCNDYKYTKLGINGMQDEEHRRLSLEALCTSLHSLLSDPATHYTAIDAKLAENLVYYAQASNLDPVFSEDQAAQSASQLLSRLPAVPPKIELPYNLCGSSSSNLDRVERYCSCKLPYDRNNQVLGSRPSPWAEFLVVSKISTVVARLALLVVTTTRTSRGNVAYTIKRFINLISELIDTDNEMKMATDRKSIVENSILQAFFWVTWQRSLMLFFWYILRHELGWGYDKEWNEMLALRGCSLLMHPSIRATLHGDANQRHSYMCPWAFEVLRSSRASIGLDFRRFHERFSTLHQNQLARCQFQSDESCEGGHPMSCGRFQDTRLVKEEQSLHDLACTGHCKKLRWNEASYKKVQGPTAVALKSRSTQIQYTVASESTLAISHVWSHGQGGRPNVGINECLHKRYLKIAREYKCDSYWIDRLCIPEDHNLRMEAIGFINRIFTNSKITLVCDRDIMDIDVPSLTTELLESVLVTFFVCDWNVRAWTLLEAMRGRHALHLLTKFNRIISLSDTLLQVHQEGSVDIVILALATHHLLSSSINKNYGPSTGQSIGEAGNLLSHRHATRDGDEIVIWSLLSGIYVYQSAEELWKSKIKSRIATAYLMSTAPRLEGISGFTWAPKTPYIRRLPSGPETGIPGLYSSYEGADSRLGLITPKGLVADWLVYYLRPEDARLYQEFSKTVAIVTNDGKRINSIIPGIRITNYCWQTAFKLSEQHEHVALIQPCSFNYAMPSYQAVKDRDESTGEVFAICTSKDEEKWVWNGVRVWPSNIIPPMVVDELLII